MAARILKLGKDCGDELTGKARKSRGKVPDQACPSGLGLKMCTVDEASRPKVRFWMRISPGIGPPGRPKTMRFRTRPTPGLPGVLWKISSRMILSDMEQCRRDLIAVSELSDKIYTVQARVPLGPFPPSRSLDPARSLLGPGRFAPKRDHEHRRSSFNI